MSFARLALRIATVRAIKGRTIAGPRVTDSEIGPIDEAPYGAFIPFVVVYTDDAEAVQSGTDLLGNDGSVALVIETGITTRQKPEESDSPEGQPPADEWVFPTTDAGMELTVDAIERQILAELARPSNAWGELWRDMATTITSKKSQRGSSAKDGVRFAGRQLVLTVGTYREPTPGRALTGTIWQRFVDQVAADPEMGADLAATLATLAMGGPLVANEHLVAMQTYALSQSRAAAMLITPATPDGAAVPFGAVTTEGGPVPPEIAPLTPEGVVSAD